MEWLTWILQGLLGLAFIMAGLGKVTGSKMHVEGFEHWRLPQWFRVVTGFLEIAAAGLLIAGFWVDHLALYGAVILSAVGIGGVLTHVRVKDGLKESFPIFVLGVLAIVLVFLL
ncbi:DoxX family protein [Paenisporosarcina indica]|uniref:DoxX family protein n=1 Tax=Paenisporosarcina indica TaxID=650093 RepID=UPI00094FA8FC|nr:DoxX family protein [Paenisporosarcina indica]